MLCNCNRVHWILHSSSAYFDRADFINKHLIQIVKTVEPASFLYLRLEVFSLMAAPCEPSGLGVEHDCKKNAAVLSWDASEGNVEYFGCAQSVGGDVFYCNSTMASCIIEGLECGDIYNFSVEASDGVCNSSFSAPLEAGAGK